MQTTSPPPGDYSPLLAVLSQSKDAMAIYDSPALNICFASEAMIRIWGKDASVIGKTFEQAIPEIKGQPFSGLLRQVWETGRTYSARSTPADLVVEGKLQRFYFDFEYRAFPDSSGKTKHLLHTATDVTREVLFLQNMEESKNALEKANTAVNQLNLGYGEINRELALKVEELNRSNTEISLLNKRLMASELHFTKLVAQAPVAILVFRGPELVIEMANPPILEILHRGEDIIGKPILESMPELRGEPAVELLFEVYRTGIASEGKEVPVQMLRGEVSETRYFNFSYRPLKDGDEIIGVMDLAVEVTDQVLANQHLASIIEEKNKLENTLRASERHLQGILDTMAEGVGITDAHGRLIYANAMARRILGLSENEVRGRTYNDSKWQNLYLDGSVMPQEEHPMTIMLRSGIPIYDQEIAVQPENGERIYISINAAPILNEEGILTGGIGTFMDVTNRRKISMQKDDFISVASHELKTPVTALKASLQLLARVHGSGRTEMLPRLIGQANAGIEKLTGLIDKLLDGNRISQGQLQIHPKIFTLSSMVENCCGHIGSAGTYRLVFKGDLTVKVNADEQQLEQVVVNFVNNAIKYAPASREIIVEIADQGENARLSVTDSGPGISPDKKAFVFDRYYRAEHKGGEFSGLGLGLYISAGIVHKHGGEIGADSEVGRGSTFWFTIPKGL